MADRNLRSLGGCSTPQVRTNQCSVIIISVSLTGQWSSEHLRCFSVSKTHLSKGNRPRSECGPTLGLSLWEPRWKRMWGSPSERVAAMWWMETLSTSRRDDRAALMENSCIFINYCVARRGFGHISSNPSVSCTWKLNHTDGCALSPLSVCVRGEPFVCANPLSLMEVKHSAFHFLDIITGGDLLCKFKHPLLEKMGRRFARSPAPPWPVPRHLCALASF